MKLFNFRYSRKKILYIVLGILVVSISSLTLVYAALSVTLNIVGSANISAALWDVHLNNVIVNSRSVSGSEPTISGGTTATFSTKLEKPGDFYEFTVDVVNDGSIDAMIESVVKTPTLTTAQAKYLNYVVEYQNGESISTRQLVEKNSFVRLKVRLEYRKDVTPDVLPSTSETLSLSFTVVYTQSDDNNENISIDNNGNVVKLLSGDYDTVGSEVCIKDECFYIISSDNDNVTMLAKYNITDDNIPIQSTSSNVIAFSSSNYWVLDNAIKLEYGENYPVYVYDKNSYIYKYVVMYQEYIENMGVYIDDARLIRYEELIELGCSSSNGCKNSSYKWIYSTSYWTGTAVSIGELCRVRSDGAFGPMYSYNVAYAQGIRPVIKISKTYFN